MLCSSVCFCESEDSAVLETVSNVQLGITAKVENAAPFSSLARALQWHRASQLSPITLSGL